MPQDILIVIAVLVAVFATIAVAYLFDRLGKEKP